MKHALTVLVVFLLSGLTTFTRAAPLVSDGLVAYYPFDASAVDASGNGRNGTAVGGVTYVPGVFDGAAHFDGSGYIRISDTIVGNLGPNATLAFWFKAEPSAFAGASGHRIFEKDDREYWSFITGTGGLGVYLRGTNSYGPPEAQFILTDKQDMIENWTAIALRKSGTTFDLFIDGSLFGEAVSTITDIVTTAPMNFGNSYFWSTRNDPQYFAGLVDEARVYNRALTDSEIRELANVGTAGVPEPGALALLGLGLIGLGMMSRRARAWRSEGGIYAQD